MSNFIKKIFSGGFHLFKKNNSVIGIDFGSSSIKIIQLRNEKGQAVLETYGELSTGPYGNLAVGQVVNLPPEKLSSLLNDLFIEANVTTRDGALAIPLRSSLLVPMELPDVGEDNLDEVIPIEARKYIPVPIAEVALDWWVLPKTEAKKDGPIKTPRLEVFMVAIHKDTLRQYEQTAKLAQVNPRFFEIETFSAMRSVLRDNRGVSAIVDIGAASTKMVIVDAGTVKLSHTINKGSQDVTLAISRSMNIPFAKAEEVKRKVGLAEKVGADDLIKVASPIVEYICAEVSRVMVDYQKKRNRSVDKVILIGGGALLKGLKEVATENIYAPVEFGSPFNRVEAPAFLDKVLGEIGPSFAVSIGLALRALEEL
ncbi:MAG: type IV pilus assembly protein PilM [Candidatus Paceibacterota bacterium]